jgi:hypothetical protein
MSRRQIGDLESRVKAKALQRLPPIVMSKLTDISLHAAEFQQPEG